MKSLYETPDLKITADLMHKVAKDVQETIIRTLDIAPPPHLFILMAGASSAILGIVAELMQLEKEKTGKKNEKLEDKPEPEYIMLSSLLVARYLIDKNDVITEAYADLDALKERLKK